MRQILILMSFGFFVLFGEKSTFGQVKELDVMTSEQHAILSGFLIEVLHSNTRIKDSLSNYSSIERIFSPTEDINEPVGIFIITPPVEPKFQFVFLKDESIYPLKTMNLQTDFVKIIKFLDKHDIHLSNTEMKGFVNKLAECYVTNNPGNRVLRRR